jgi:hypothetical protein
MTRDLQRDEIRKRFADLSASAKLQMSPVTSVPEKFRQLDRFEIDYSIVNFEPNKTAFTRGINLNFKDTFVDLLD